MKKQCKKNSGGNQITLDVQNGDCRYVYIYQVMAVTRDGISHVIRNYFSKKDAESAAVTIDRLNSDLYLSVFVLRDLCFV